jgi:transcription initiation factor TFIIA large subunit
MMQHSHYPNHYAPPLPHQQSPHVKAEPLDNRYILNGPPGMPSYGLPALPGPQLNGARPPHPGGQQSVLSFPPGPPPPNRTPVAPPPRLYPPPPAQPAQPQLQPPRIPQVDGPSSSSSDSSSPPPSQPASQTQASPATGAAQPDDPEAINSDLDDSDTEGEEEAEEGAGGENDIVFCTYDKVARVKNKWKCILKDGMIHINGRDYLFAKCTGEFEW